MNQILIVVAYIDKARRVSAIRRQKYEARPRLDQLLQLNVYKSVYFTMQYLQENFLYSMYEFYKYV